MSTVGGTRVRYEAGPGWGKETDSTEQLVVEIEFHLSLLLEDFEDLYGFGNNLDFD